MPFIRTKIKEGKKYRYLVKITGTKRKKLKTESDSVSRLDIGAEGSEKLISPSHKMDEIERAIPVGKLALYYAAAQYIDLGDAMEKYCHSQSFPVLAL